MCAQQVGAQWVLVAVYMPAACVPNSCRTPEGASHLRAAEKQLQLPQLLASACASAAAARAAMTAPPEDRPPGQTAAHAPGMLQGSGSNLNGTAAGPVPATQSAAGGPAAHERAPVGSTTLEVAVDAKSREAAAGAAVLEDGGPVRVESSEIGVAAATGPLGPGLALTDVTMAGMAAEAGEDTVKGCQGQGSGGMLAAVGGGGDFATRHADTPAAPSPLDNLAS